MHLNMPVSFDHCLILVLHMSKRLIIHQQASSDMTPSLYNKRRKTPQKKEKIPCIKAQDFSPAGLSRREKYGVRLSRPPT